ncbi:type VII secretion protein EccB [Streptomyces sp. NBC_00102]|uniref:type VII secretion protein EccB n=1 Tax=Streptomyces sp. NBC_00102 TaxID=2975652 RepID=UPI00225181A0|nr:type VII secretion protein EccB [Streptomyces sp. NBC_00102]MCX5401153.1 type VII secretion protein EccB [Streptomyces sp. NBC_00102]
MQSKRDQVQAHAFVMGRLTSGMLLADPDAPESPLGRTTRGAGIGMLIGVLIAAGAVVFGLISPGGNDSWRSGKNLIVNRDTGARYLYLDGRLRPVRNYSSALLIGGADLETTDVGAASLRDTPVGAAVGIPGAPDGVPSSGDLDSGAWAVCSATATDGAAGSEGRKTRAVTAVAAGAPLGSTALGADKAVLVSGPDKRNYLIWQGSRLPLDTRSGALLSLGYSSVTPRPVSAAFLDSFVPGPALAPPSVEGLGSKGPSLDGTATRIGQVFRVTVPGDSATGSGEQAGAQYFLLGDSGLSPVTSTAVALLLGDPAVRSKAYDGDSPTALPIGADLLKDHQAPGTTGRDPSVAGLPDNPPWAARVPDGSAVCARVQPGGDGVRISSVLVPTGALGPVAQRSKDAVVDACLPVDAVVVRPGHGVLARALGAGGGTVGATTYFVADDGVKYRVGSKEALTALGWTDSDARGLPSPLLAMLPTGPDLSPQAATGLVPASPARACAEGSADSPGGPAGRVGTSDAADNKLLPSKHS